MYKEPPFTRRQVERLILRPTLRGIQQPTSVPSFSVNVFLGKSTTQTDKIPTKTENTFPHGSFSESASALVSETDRLATANEETSSMNFKMPVSCAFGRWVKGVLLHRLPKTALTGAIAQQSESFEAMRPVILNKAKRSAGRPPKHKPVTADSAHTLSKNLHSASASARRRILKPSDGAGKNGAAEYTNSVAYPLLPGATSLTGGQFLSARSIYSLLSEPTVRERAVLRIPSGLKVDCYFVVNIGAELTDYEKYKDNENCRKISDKLYDGTGSWNYYIDSSNNQLFTISDSGVFKWVKITRSNVSFDLRMHRATFRNSAPFDWEQPTERRICWFFNGKHSPAPGFVFVMYRGVSHNDITRHRKLCIRKALASTARSTNKVKEGAAISSEEEEAEDDDEKYEPATKRS